MRRLSLVLQSNKGGKVGVMRERTATTQNKSTTTTNSTQPQPQILQSTCNQPSMSSRVAGGHHQQQPKRRPRRRQVCLFGTSANPPTGLGGHMGVVQALVDLKQFDEILVLPVYRHMFDTKRTQLVSYEHRVEMCRIALKELEQSCLSGNSDGNGNGGEGENGYGNARRPSTTTMTTKVSVSTAEELCYQRLVAQSSDNSDTDSTMNQQPQSDVTTAAATTTTANIRVGTADLLEMLQEQEPDTDYTFCLGGDTFLDLTAWKWKRSKDVLRLLDRRLVVIYRKGLTATAGGHDNDGNRDSSNSNDEEELTHRRLLIERVDIINNDHTLGRQRNEDNNNGGHADCDNRDGEVARNRGRVQLLDVPCLGDVSSSTARRMNDPERLKTILPTSVVQYIVDHELYSFSSPSDDLEE